MSPIRPTSRAVAALMVCLLTIGLWQVGEGSWIYAKAGLAQLLLQRAWSRTLAGAAHVKPWPWADTWPIARLVVPSLGIDQIVLEGAYGRTLAFGPGHLESEDGLDDSGTIILTGHRDTHFQFLKRLTQHDEIVIETVSGKNRRYLIRDIQIVDSRKAFIRLGPGADRLILVTCYPFDAIAAGGPLRYVVIAESKEERS
jgi:sortase A